MPGSFTAIVNPDLFRYLLDLEVKRATRYSYFFSLLLIEVDQSHHKGLEHLDTIARLIMDEIREVDIVGKIESDRFSALLQAETKPAQSISERIKNRILNYSFLNGESKEKQEITISVGGVCFPTHGVNSNELTSQAIQLLGVARAEGGNKVYFPGPG
jgi:diguanylate cyclase (GGDEF)-like protein